MTDLTEASSQYHIEEVKNEALYGELRTLWCEVFGDDPAYVDSFYENFGDDIKGFVALDSGGQAAAALTLYPCGSYRGRPVYVSYAVCTAEDKRGRGIASLLASHVRDLVISKGGISLVSPAEPGLEDFYAALGYKAHFMASELAVMSPAFDDDEEPGDFGDFSEYELDFGADGGPVRPAADIRRLDAASYNRYREAFLAGRPHIELSKAMLDLAVSESEGFYSVNRGDAVFALSSSDPFKTVLSEFILNPVLEELSLGIDAEIASMLADHFGSAELYYRTPGSGRCQSMAAGLDDSQRAAGEWTEQEGEPYFGFPVD